MWIAIAAVVITLSSVGPIMSMVDEPKYSVISEQGNIQIREYVPIIVAETKVSGERKEAINQGFRIIADYIFGNNSPNQKIAMTAPVIQEADISEGNEIAMTAPVTQQADKNQWKVRFVMPEEYTLSTLPKPNNSKIKLIQINSQRYAVIKFSGTSSDENLGEHKDKLLQYIKQNRLQAIGEPVFAFYNPPWTLPFLKRNEIMIEIKKG